MTRLSLRHISKTFVVERGDITAVCDVTLDVAEGEFFTLLGPSGCGKTTALRCIAGFETPDDGEIILDGQLVYSRSKGQVVPVNQRDIGVVFQSYAIWPHMNVFDNVAYPLRYGLRKRPEKSEIRKRVTDSLALVHLRGMEDRATTQLSGGQQQRVALARALVRNPKLLLLDEPLSNLDAKLREEMRSEMRELVHKLGITTVYVTHDQLEALSMSDRIAVMYEGRFVQIGTSRDIYERPIDAFIANFIGAANLLEGRFKRDSTIESGGVIETRIGPIVIAAGKGFPDGQNVKVAIRPENIEIGDFKNKNTVKAFGSVNAFEGHIESLDFQGDVLVLRVRAGTELIRAKTGPSEELNIGQRVYLIVRPIHCQALPA